MNKICYLKRNKYIRLKVERPAMSFRASISINKYFWNEKENKYYEINFETFHPYDYQNEQEALKKAKEWLKNELEEFQKGLIECIE